MDRETQFQDLRPLLFGLAYRMLGRRADAEDVVQDAYLCWQSAPAEEVRSPKSYLTTIVARLALDELKAAYRRRETYVGTWLPEPLVQPAGTKPLEMAESLSLAFLRLLETLSPAERVAFLLREVFDAKRLLPAPSASGVNFRMRFGALFFTMNGAWPPYCGIFVMLSAKFNGLLPSSWLLPC
jgi:RNA polymerase sigma factor (sigma-70 family)